jgi:hypothetical protein
MMKQNLLKHVVLYLNYINSVLKYEAFFRVIDATYFGKAFLLIKFPETINIEWLYQP